MNIELGFIMNTQWLIYPCVGIMLDILLRMIHEKDTGKHASTKEALISMSASAVVWPVFVMMLIYSMAQEDEHGC
jgi:hypothetical protein